MARGLTKGAQSQKQIPCEVKSARETNVRMISRSQAELLCAGPAEVVETAGLAVIGSLQADEGVVVLDAQGKPRSGAEGGFRHFA